MNYSISKSNDLYRDGNKVGRVKFDGYDWDLSPVFTDEDECVLFDTFCNCLSRDETIRLLKGD